MNQLVSRESGLEPIHPGARLRQMMDTAEAIPLIGVYDTFSASIAGRHFQGIFVSGFSFAASHYGLPDIGFIAWPDMLAFVQRLRAVLPHHHIVVDIDGLQGPSEVVIIADETADPKCCAADLLAQAEQQDVARGLR